MGRKHRPSKHLRPVRPLNPVSHAYSEHKSDWSYVVRKVPADRAVKTYVCPGCNHRVAPGTPHVVAWPHDPTIFEESPVALRRHWHSGCWRQKL